MSAEEDYPILAHVAAGSQGAHAAHEAARALDEIQLLRVDVSRLLAKLAQAEASPAP